MGKIMFNDKIGLTQAVLDGRKTQTRRIVPQSVIDEYDEWRSDVECIAKPAGSTIEPLCSYLLRKSRFYVGEIVTVAQSYKDVYDEQQGLEIMDMLIQELKNSKGWNNKMFVRAALMPHQIRITNVRIERLQDISGKDCLKEGIIKGRCGSEDTHFMDAYYCPTDIQPYCEPREAFAHLINKVSRKDVWSENPYVFVYDFALIK